MTLPVAGKDTSQYVAQNLDQRGIELLAEHKLTEVDGESRRVRFENGSELEYTVLLGVPASAPPGVVEQSPLAAASGWIEPDKRSLQTSFDRVYAVATAPPSPRPRASCRKPEYLLLRRPSCPLTTLPPTSVAEDAESWTGTASVSWSCRDGEWPTSKAYFL
jgi:hypothetical protein